MGKKDDAMYDYLEDPNKFADLVNVVLHQGMQVIDGSMLKPDDIRYVDFTIFKTELGQLLQAISCKNDKEKLKKLLRDKNYSHLERETAEAIAIMTDNASLLEKLDEYENEGGYNMCKGLDDWAKEEQEKSEIRGKIERGSGKNIWLSYKMANMLLQTRIVC